MDIEVDLDDDNSYIPETVLIYDNGCVIFDSAEFCDIYNCIAAQFYDGILLVLDRDSRKWVNAEGEKKSGNLRPVN